jgi:hypothetical protein
VGQVPADISTVVGTDYHRSEQQDSPKSSTLKTLDIRNSSQLLSTKNNRNATFAVHPAEAC